MKQDPVRDTDIKDVSGGRPGIFGKIGITQPPHTYIKVMTDGILLAETQSDRHLKQYDTIFLPL